MQLRKMLYKFILPIFCVLLLGSCIVQSPKYTSLDKVISLELGMTKEQVEEILGVAPYDIKASNDSNRSYIYVYRLTDRRTLSFHTQPTNGKEVIGKYMQLQVAYSYANKVTKIESCSTCLDNLVNTKKLDFQKLIVFVTITLPVILVFIGLN